MKIASILLVILPFIKPTITDVNLKVSIVTPQEINNTTTIKCMYGIRDMSLPTDILPDSLDVSYFKETHGFKTCFKSCKVKDKGIFANSICCIRDLKARHKHNQYSVQYTFDSEYINKIRKSCNMICLKGESDSLTHTIPEIIDCCKATDPETPCSNFKLIIINYSSKYKTKCFVLVKDKTCLVAVNVKTDASEYIEVAYKEPINKNEDSQEENTIEVKVIKKEN